MNKPRLMICVFMVSSIFPSLGFADVYGDPYGQEGKVGELCSNEYGALEYGLSAGVDIQLDSQYVRSFAEAELYGEFDSSQPPPEVTVWMSAVTSVDEEIVSLDTFEHEWNSHVVSYNGDPFFVRVQQLKDMIPIESNGQFNECELDAFVRVTIESPNCGWPARKSEHAHVEYKWDC